MISRLSILKVILSLINACKKYFLFFRSFVPFKTKLGSKTKGVALASGGLQNQKFFLIFLHLYIFGYLPKYLLVE